MPDPSNPLDPNNQNPYQDQEEVANDAVIGKAFARTLAIIFAAVVPGVLIWFMNSREAPPALNAPAAVQLPNQRDQRDAAEIPTVPLLDITREAGIVFQHENGAAGEKLLPETMGGGCAFLDYDSDGDQDFILVNSCRWPWDDRPATAAPAVTPLFQNDGKGKFTEVGIQCGLTDTFYGQGVAVGDYDNDGDSDLFISAVGVGRLYRNDAGRFLDITKTSGVGGAPNEWGTSCGWFDYDHDGDLDLFVANYVEWSREFDIAQNFQLTGGGRAYGRPQHFPGAYVHLYRNDGQDKFAEVSEAAGLRVTNPNTRVPVGKSLGVTFVDCDADGWLDIVVANDTVQNFLFHNLKNGTFEEIGAIAGIAFDDAGNARGAMGVDSAFFRNNADLGIAIGNFANEMTALYVSHAHSGQFSDEAVATGLGPQSRLELKFGTLFCDLDLDGRQDLLSANGHLEEDIHRVQRTQHYEQPPHLFWNAGLAESTEFIPIPAEKCGPQFMQPLVGRGASCADIDADGDLDLLIATSGREPKLYRNDQQLGHHWLRLKLRGTTSNRDAIGATLSLQLNDGTTLKSQVMPTRSYLSQTETVVTFGLGKRAATELTIRWPGGGEQVVTNLPIDTLLEVEQIGAAKAPTGATPATNKTN